MSSAKPNLSVWPVVATVITVALLVVAGARFLTAWAHHQVAAEHEQKVVQVDRAAVDDYVAQQEALLENYSWIDRDAGVVSLPIDRAMQLIADEDGGER